MLNTLYTLLVIKEKNKYQQVLMHLKIADTKKKSRLFFSIVIQLLSINFPLFLSFIFAIMKISRVFPTLYFHYLCFCFSFSELFKFYCFIRGFLFFFCMWPFWERKQFNGSNKIYFCNFTSTNYNLWLQFCLLHWQVFPLIHFTLLLLTLIVVVVVVVVVRITFLNNPPPLLSISSTHRWTLFSCNTVIIVFLYSVSFF